MQCIIKLRIVRTKMFLILTLNCELVILLHNKRIEDICANKTTNYELLGTMFVS